MNLPTHVGLLVHQNPNNLVQISHLLLVRGHQYMTLSLRLCRVSSNFASTQPSRDPPQPCLALNASFFRALTTNLQWLCSCPKHYAHLATLQHEVQTGLLFAPAPNSKIYPPCAYPAEPCAHSSAEPAAHAVAPLDPVSQTPASDGEQCSGGTFTLSSGVPPFNSTLSSCTFWTMVETS